jgi:hypothetical protein
MHEPLLLRNIVFKKKHRPAGARDFSLTFLTKPVIYRTKDVAPFFSPTKKNPKPVAPQSPSWLWGFFYIKFRAFAGCRSRQSLEQIHAGLIVKKISLPQICTRHLQKLSRACLKYQGLAHGLISDIVGSMDRLADLGTFNCHSLNSMSIYRWE